MKARPPNSPPSWYRNGSRIRRRTFSPRTSAFPSRPSRTSRCATSTSSRAKSPATPAGHGVGVGERAAPPHPFTFSLGSGAPARETRGGTVHIADSRNFTVSTTIAAALLTIHPGGMREMHWHPNADEWQYWIKGKGQMTIFNTGPNAVTMDFNAGDIGY